jgi:hypothetical protein
MRTRTKVVLAFALGVELGVALGRHDARRPDATPRPTDPFDVLDDLDTNAWREWGHAVNRSHGSVPSESSVADGTPTS